MIDGFEDYEDKLIDHLEKEHAYENRRLSVEGWHERLKRHTKVEEQLLPPGANPWIRRQYSSKIQTGIGAVEPESLR